MNKAAFFFLIIGVAVWLLIAGESHRFPFNPKDCRPHDQFEYENSLMKLRQQTKFNSNNEINRDLAQRELNNFLGQKVSVTEWIGTVTSVEKTLLNGNGVRLTSETLERKTYDGVCYFLLGISDNQLSALKYGDKIKFSGTVEGVDVVSFKGLISSVKNEDILEVQASTLSIR